jgi:hypothetical protein
MVRILDLWKVYPPKRCCFALADLKGWLHTYELHAEGGLSISLCYVSLCITAVFYSESRDGRFTRLFRHGDHNSQHHRQVENAQTEMLDLVFLKPHRTLPDHTDGFAWPDSHRPDSTVRRLPLYHVHHYFRHQLLHLGCDGTQDQIHRHQPSRRPEVD